MFFEILLLFIGQIAAAVSIFLIRSSELAAGYIAAYRLFLAVLIALPFVFVDVNTLKTGGMRVGVIARTWLATCTVPGIMLGIHFVLWNLAATRTLAANASLIVNMVPVVMPLVVFGLTREKPRPREVVATFVAMSGVILLTFGDVSVGAGGAGAAGALAGAQGGVGAEGAGGVGVVAEGGFTGTSHLQGDLFAFVSMLFLAVYLALSKKNRHLPFWFYVSGVYFFGGLSAFLFFVLRGAPLWSERGWVEVLPIVGLTLVPTLLGHNLINRAMRTIPSQLVSVGQLSQVLWAGILAWFIYGELPRPVFYPSVLLIGLGMGMIVYSHYIHQHKTNKVVKQ